VEGGVEGVEGDTIKWKEGDPIQCGRVEGGFKDSFHPSNPLFIGISVHRWKDGGIF
jgi:hypothetical protein